VEIRRRCRPKTLRFQVLTWLWAVPSGGALVVLAVDWPSWSHFEGVSARLGAVPLQSWIALAILLVHGLFFTLWRHYRRNEPWREKIFLDSDPGSSPTLPTPSVP
jgi:hypothetical protein